MSEPDQLLLQQALATISGDRRKDYGNPEDNFQVIADLWNAYLAHRGIQGEAVSAAPTLSATDIAALMTLMKVARLVSSPDHADSWRDIAGYAACGARVSGADLGATDTKPADPTHQDPAYQSAVHSMCAGIDSGISATFPGYTRTWNMWIDTIFNPHADTLDVPHIQGRAHVDLGLSLSNEEAHSILYRYLNRKEQTND